jgi:hypothetical protein
MKKVSVENSYLLLEVERVQLKKSSFEGVDIRNWFEFWRWLTRNGKEGIRR